MEVNDSNYKISETNYRESNDNPASSNVSVTNIDAETNIKLRGDAIGDSLYSQSFVLKTLLQLSDLKWSEEVEEDFCFLWDMTVEKDVCNYLFELSFPSLACSAIMTHTDNRFIEIIIGILANTLCADCNKNVTDAEIMIILRELDTDDPLILIQLVRFICSIVHKSKELPFITENVLNKIKFILYNSTNTELLLKSLEAVAKMTTDFKLNRSFLDIDIFYSVLIAYQTVMFSDTNEFELESRNKQLTCRYMIEIVSNIYAYIDQYEDNEFQLQLKQYSDIFIDEVIKILNFFQHEENLLPVTDEFLFYISVFQFVLDMLNINYKSKLFLPLTEILYQVSNIKDEVIELFTSVLNLVSFFFSRATPKLIWKDLKSLPRNKLKLILKVVYESDCEYDVKFNIQQLLNKCK